MNTKKLNLLGNIIERNKNMPYLSDKNKGQQVLEVTYGHNDNGKQRYTYVGNTHRTGDIVTPYVTNPKSGKTYRTLAVVRATHSLKNGQGMVTKLQSQGKPVKRIGPTSQTTLPGFISRKSEDQTFTAKQWAQEAKNQQMQKLNQFGEPIGGNK